jgi:hypothetical protein
MVHGADRDHRNQQQLEPRGALVRPLGAFERMYYRFSQNSTLHFCVVAELADDLDPSALDAALSVVQQHHPLLNVYVEDHPQTGPVGRLRRFVQTPGAVNAAAQSDLRKVARAIIAVADQTPAPTRLALGPDAYDYIHEELTTRIAELESLTDVSSGVAVDGPLPVANWR